MTARLPTWPLALLVVFAVLAGTNAGAAAWRWLEVWRGLDRFTVTLLDIQVAEDASAVVVHLRLENGSGRPVRIGFARAGLWLNGRSLTAGETSLPSVELAPGARYDVELRGNVYAELRAYLQSQRDTGHLSWRVTGEIRLRVDELTDWILLPYRGTWETEV